MVNRKMKIHLQSVMVVGLSCMISSCASGPPGEASLVRQRIPIEIHAGKPVTIEIRARSPGGKSEVGIRCSPEAWNALTNATRSITVELVSSNDEGAQIRSIPPGYTAQCPIESFYDLFYLYGMSGLRPRAVVQITFPNAPPVGTRAEILVCRTSADSL